MQSFRAIEVPPQNCNKTIVYAWVELRNIIIIMMMSYNAFRLLNYLKTVAAKANYIFVSILHGGSQINYYH